MRTKRVLRQLKKSFGDEAVEARLVAFAAPDATPDFAAFREIAGNFPGFLDAVEEVYRQLEDRLGVAQRSMEVSAEELTQANSNLLRLNQTFDAMVNSLGQGFVLIGRDGICLEVCSKACEDLLETNPAGRHIADVLLVPANKREGFSGWLEILFQDRLDFVEFAKLGPSRFPHSRGKKVSVEYKPVRNAGGEVELVIAIATDFTREYEAQESAKEMRAHVILATSILRDKERFLDFVSQSRELMEKAQELTGPAVLSAEAFREIKRHLHTLKGAAGSFGMLAVQTRVHDIETELAKRELPENSREYLITELPKLRALFEKGLDDNAHIIGSLAGAGEPHRRVPLAKLEKLSRLLSPGREAVDLLDELISQSPEEVFRRYEAVLRNAAARQGKKVRRLSVSGDDVRLVPEDYHGLFMALDHVFRNIVDHGIEPPDEREAAGKDREGRVAVEIARAGAFAEIRIRDDGRGVDVQRVQRKLKDMGHGDLAARGSRADLLDAIFLPGLSTAHTVTETAGRGVGLDAVRAAVNECGGQIRVESEEGRGTTFVIRLPLRRSRLTLAA